MSLVKSNRNSESYADELFSASSTPLLSCPFCGSKAMVEGGGTRHKVGKLPLTISCSSRICLVSPSVTGTRPSVVERWNTRHAPVGIKVPSKEIKEERLTCSLCHWTNVSLVNLGEPGKPRWVCQGCCKKVLKAEDDRLGTALKAVDSVTTGTFSDMIADAN